VSAARSPFDTQITGYRVVRGKTVIDKYACPACPRRAYYICAKSATGCARRVIREQGGQVTVERLPDGAVLSRHDVPPKGKSAEDWKGFLAADVEDPEDGVEELEFDEEPTRATDAGPGIEDGNDSAADAAEQESA
jgi:hypothetical protein